MPKVNSIQTSFVGGEFSPILYGQVRADRFKSGLQVCLNYIPTLQGPLLRRPGTKYVTNVKDSVNTPALVPFVFSQTQAYVLEFGDRYIRFFTDDGQLITSSNAFKVSGAFGFPGKLAVTGSFTSIRPNLAPRLGEGQISASSLVAAGSPVEVQSPYSYLDVSQLKFAQQNDTLFLVHPTYPVMKLQRYGNEEWDLKQAYFQDGPYLPINSYKTLGDSTRIYLSPDATSTPTVTTGPKYTIIACSGASSGGYIRLTTNTTHAYATGDKVYVSGVVGPTQANNGTSSIQASFWSISVPNTTQIDLVGSVHTATALVGSAATVAPALFQMISNSGGGFGAALWGDHDTLTTGSSMVSARNIGLVGSEGFRHWGHISAVTNPSQANVVIEGGDLANTSNILFWQLGVFSGVTGFPGTACFHQDRLCLGGALNTPQQIDGSKTGDYENFAASGSSLQVTDANAFQFRLLAEESNPVVWMRSAAQGLLAGTKSAEWQIAPNSQSQALTPTNVTAQPTSFYGSGNVDAVKSGNAILYVQNAQRKIREMNYFFNIGTFRSTDLTEIAEHITIPTVTRLTVQKETIPLVWGLRSDGNLISMAYSRDDVSLKAGWARHILGGQGPGGGNPVVKSICAVPATVNSSIYDQVWMVVQRSTVTGSTYTSVEYTTKPFDDSIEQQDAFLGDCGATYDSPLTITFISNSSVCFVTAPGHGLANGDQVRINGVVGLNSSLVDAYGTTTMSNLVNNKTFIVGSASFLSFALLDFDGVTPTNSIDYSFYVSGGAVRKMVKTITGLNWLAGETVGILADGAIHPDVVVTGSGAITLNYRAAKVQIGYRYNSDGQSLRQDGGSAQGSAIGETSRMHRVAVQFHRMGDLSMGQTFDDLVPVKFQQADQQQADQATPLASGIERDATGAGYDFDGWVCWRQSSMLPGMIQSLTYFSEVMDV